MQHTLWQITRLLQTSIIAIAIYYTLQIKKINHSSYNSHFNRPAYATVFNKVICRANALLRQIPQHFEVNSAANSSTHMQYI